MYINGLFYCFFGPGYWLWIAFFPWPSAPVYFMGVLAAIAGDLSDSDGLITLFLCTIRQTNIAMENWWALPCIDGLPLNMIADKVTCSFSCHAQTKVVPYRLWGFLRSQTLRRLMQNQGIGIGSSPIGNEAFAHPSAGPKRGKTKLESQ